jgi:hypothetical protein
VSYVLTYEKHPRNTGRDGFASGCAARLVLEIEPASHEEHAEARDTFVAALRAIGRMLSTDDVALDEQIQAVQDMFAETHEP